jgi:hypothetical protein
MRHGRLRIFGGKVFGVFVEAASGVPRGRRKHSFRVA